MALTVLVIDYGISNLFSVCRALEYCGAKVIVSNDPKALLSANRVVLPGVGAYSDGMKGLQTHNLDKAILEFFHMGKPLLGICLGMQMLASVSEEFGVHDGLNIIPGRVVAIPQENPQGICHPVPHVGWADLILGDNLSDWQETILDGISEGEAVYMTHSFAVQPNDETHRLANCMYNGVLISAAIRNKNFYGVQFHPEKSGAVGLKILSNFLKLT